MFKEMIQSIYNLLFHKNIQIYMLKSIVKKDDQPNNKNKPIEILSKLLDSKLANEKHS